MVFIGACDLWADEDKWAFRATPHGHSHHVSFLWQSQLHLSFGHPACSVVDGNAQKPERDMRTVVRGESVIAGIFGGNVVWVEVPLILAAPIHYIERGPGIVAVHR